MPTLERRTTDGGYYIRHFYGDHHTWQIVGEGVRFLAGRGVTEGSHFTTDLFMDLWTRAWVYHGDKIPSTAPRPNMDAGVKAGLERRIGEFYRLARAMDDQRAWKLVATAVIAEEHPGESSETSFRRFSGELQAMRLDHWNPLDIRAYDTEVEVGEGDSPRFRATKVGMGSVRLSLRTASNFVEQQDVTHYWLWSDSQWWIMWRPVQPGGAPTRAGA